MTAPAVIPVEPPALSFGQIASPGKDPVPERHAERSLTPPMIGTIPDQVLNDRPRISRPSVIKDAASNARNSVINDKGKGRLPKAKSNGRPPKKRGYIWQSHGSGWDCRRDERIKGKGPRPYVAHLSGPEFEKMKTLHKSPDALAIALETWITDKEKSKGIQHAK